VQHCYQPLALRITGLLASALLDYSKRSADPRAIRVLLLQSAELVRVSTPSSKSVFRLARHSRRGGVSSWPYAAKRWDPSASDSTPVAPLLIFGS
jgi:hypothetical protein